MPGPLRRRYAATVPLALALTALVAAGCGDDDKDKSSKAPDEPSKATTMSITTTDIGKKQFKMEAPKSIEGGLVKVNFHNAGKVPHEASLARLDGGHTVDEVIKKFGGEKVVAGNIIVRQCGTKWHPGRNVGLGTDYTIYSLIDGVVKFEHKSKTRYKVSVYPAVANEDTSSAA